MRKANLETARRCFLILLFLAPARSAAAQHAILTSGLNLRTGPSRSYKIDRSLAKGDTVALLSATMRNQYYHVSTPDGREGWIWAKRVSLLTDTQPASTASAGVPTQPAGPKVALVDSLTAWDKPSAIELDTGRCAAAGAGIARVDSATDLRKNRIDTADVYHQLPFEMILNLPWDSLPTRRYRWSADNGAAVARYEGVPVAVEGYLAGAKEEGKEATNCGLDTPDWHDWHIWLVATQVEGTSKDRTSAIVVEVTPRVRAVEPGWALDSLKSFQRRGDRVRISGWLMLDPDHPDQVRKTRGTTWEIHPVTRIEVSRDGRWSSLAGEQR